MNCETDVPDTANPLPTASPAAGLVTIIVRSMHRPSLAPTLASIAAQSHFPIEVIVVNARGGAHDTLGGRCGEFPLRVVNQHGPALARAAAANAGLEAARGAWLMFVDDDDCIDADHVARLLAALLDAPNQLAAYSGTRIVDAAGAQMKVLDEAFDSGRLWQANFLPIHAVLFSRRAVDDGLRFDTSLPVYEDWDFWRQLSLLHPFRHVEGVSATYRWVGDSGLTDRRDEGLAASARSQFYRKWLPRLDADDFEQLATAAEHQRGQIAQHRAHIVDLSAHIVDLSGQIAALVEQAAAFRQQITDRDGRLEAADRRIDGLEHQLSQARADIAHTEQDLALARDALDEVSRHGADLLRQLQEARSDYRNLEAAHLATLSTLSWRVTAPLRVVRGAFTPAGLRAASRQVIRRLPTGFKEWLRGRLRRSEAGVRLLQRVSPAPIVAPPPPQAPTIDKEAERRQAEVELTAFLASGQRIALDLAGADVDPDVTVIVVVYNQAGLTWRCLQALAGSQGARIQTIIVDNASSDRMPELLERVVGAQVLRQRENLGFLRAVNVAARHARGRHLLLLNNDALVEPTTIARGIRRLDADPGAGAVGGMILLWDGRLQEAGSIVWADGSCLGYGRGDSPDAPQYRFVRDVDYCSGALLLVRRELFEALGGLDDSYAPAYYEETDFCMRLWQAGHRVVYDPQVRVHHFEFASDEGSGRAIELQQRNRLRFVERHAHALASRSAPAAAAVLSARHVLAAGAQRVLLIDDRVPLRWLGQGFPRAADLLCTLVAKGHFVSLYPLQFPTDGESEARQELPETAELLFGLGLARLAEFLVERDGYYDTVIVSRPHNMQALRAELHGLRKRWPRLLGEAQVVYDAEALFSLREIEKARVQGMPLDEGEQRRLIDQEVALARDADRVLAVSDLEASHYRAAGFPDVHVLGHVVRAMPGEAPFDARRGFLFVGALAADDTPNADSLLWFVAEVWPLITAALGGHASLTIVGHCESPAVRALERDDIRIVGRVDALDASMDAARVFIVPTRFAAGIPHKAHEAAARGLPIVASPLIARQLGWGDDMPVGADAAGFALACVKLHEDSRHWQEVRERLLAAVRRDCAPEAFEACVDRILTRPAPRNVSR